MKLGRAETTSCDRRSGAGTLPRERKMWRFCWAIVIIAYATSGSIAQEKQAPIKFEYKSSEWWYFTGSSLLATKPVVDGNKEPIFLSLSCELSKPSSPLILIIESPGRDHVDVEPVAGKVDDSFDTLFEVTINGTVFKIYGFSSIDAQLDIQHNILLSATQRVKLLQEFLEKGGELKINVVEHRFSLDQDPKEDFPKEVAGRLMNAEFSLILTDPSDPEHLNFVAKYERFKKDCMTEGRQSPGDRITSFPPRHSNYVFYHESTDWRYASNADIRTLTALSSDGTTSFGILCREYKPYLVMMMHNVVFRDLQKFRTKDKPWQDSFDGLFDVKINGRQIDLPGEFTINNDLETNFMVMAELGKDHLKDFLTTKDGKLEIAIKGSPRPQGKLNAPPPLMAVLLRKTKFVFQITSLDDQKFQAGYIVVKPCIDPPTLTTGTYKLAGINPQGGQYKGTVTISKNADGTYLFEWLIGKSERYSGTGELKGNEIAVYWGGGSPAIYTITNDKTLHGTWDGGAGKEFLSLE